MKKIQILTGVMLFVLITVLIFHSCKKDNNESIATTTVNELQNSESQDAVADKVENDIDNSVDKMEANDFNISTQKSSFDDCVTVEVDHPDTTDWPKTITITVNCSDTVNGEIINQHGTIVIVVNATNKPWRKFLTRTITFSNYSITADSSTITINGTRAMTRKSVDVIWLDDLKKEFRIQVLDSIQSNLVFTAAYADTTITFTRIANKSRNMIAYFHRLTGGLRYYNEIKKDTVIFNGNITGLNARGIPYERNITSPLEITFCPIWPHNPIISTGTITYIAGNNTATISYSATGCQTKVTITKNGVTKEIDRKFGKRFKRWW